MLLLSVCVATLLRMKFFENWSNARFEALFTSSSKLYAFEKTDVIFLFLVFKIDLAYKDLFLLKSYDDEKLDSNDY